MKYPLTSHLVLLLATHSLASVSTKRVQFLRPGTNYRIHPVLEDKLSNQVEDVAGCYLEFQTTSDRHPELKIDEFMLSATLGKTTPKDLSTMPIKIRKIGMVTLETTPLVNNHGVEIGRQWSGCVPNHGSLTQNDELFLAPTRVAEIYADKREPEIRNSLSTRALFEKIATIDTSSPKNFKEDFGNLRFYSLVTPDAMHMKVTSSQKFTGTQALTFIPVDCGCPETADPSCLIQFDGHNSLLLKPSTAYQVVYRGPGVAKVHFEDYKIPDVSSKNGNVPVPDVSSKNDSAEHQSVSLALFGIIAICCFLY